MSALESQTVHVCPKCEMANTIDQLSQREYRCAKCGFELAYLDIAVSGAIRGIFGWLCSVGDTIQDRYHIKSVLGKGGFGATYLVEDLKLSGKRRAIKEVPELMFDEYETQLLSRLNHPSIPDITDRTTADGMVYLVLEFGGTRTLASERKRLGDKIPLHTLLPWMRQLCDVLDYLHTQTPPIIHRDLKPENILLDDGDRIMLIDFGIAKEATPSSMTRALGRAATHGFSPPEQAMGTGTDERSDIYALGATLYALLTGTNPPAAHERVAGKPVQPPSELVPGLPPLLDETILKSLSLNVNHRHQSVAEFGRVLDSLAGRLGSAPLFTAENSSKTMMVGEVRSRPTTKAPSIRIPTSGPIGVAASAGARAPGHGWRALALLGTVIAGALAAGGYWVWSRPEPAKTAPSTLAPVIPDVTAPATVTPGTTQAPAPPHSETAVVAPQPAPAPPSATAAKPPAGTSAVEILDRKFQESLKQDAKSQRKVIVSEKVTKVEPPPREFTKPRKSPPKSKEPEWNIIPGEAQKTTN